MDSRTKKTFAKHGCLHGRSNAARLYLPRKEVGRGLTGIEKCVKRERERILIGWRKLAQREYRKGLGLEFRVTTTDKVALWLHWELCGKYELECTDKCYD